MEQQISGKTIWKYKIPDQTCLEVELPLGAMPVWGHIQDGEVTVWFELDPKNRSKETRKFSVYATGADIPLAATYVTSIWDIRWIWHVYEVTNAYDIDIQKCADNNIDKNKMFIH